MTPRAENLRHCVTRLIAVFATAFASATSARGGDAAWEWSPYRVGFTWKIAEQPQSGAAVEPEFPTPVMTRLRERFGPAWLATTDDVDKRFEITLDYEHGSHRVVVREWDALLEQFGPAILRRTSQAEALVDMTAAAVAEAFRPWLSIDEARGTTALVRQRAGGLYPAATLDALTRRKAAYVPIVRRFDRDGVVLETKAIPWTLLEIDEPRGREAVCIIRSGLNNPLSSRRRGRVEKTAVAVGATIGSTTVRVTTRDGRPLAGCRVLAQDGDAPATSLGRTDERGAVVVPAAEGRVQMLVVTSQYKPLARLPIVPGAVDEIDVPTIGEPELLTAEDRLVAWQAKFHDVYVQRRVLAAIVEGYLEAEDGAAAKAALARLDDLPSTKELTTELESLRRKFIAVPAHAAPLIASLFDDAAATGAALDDSAAVVELRRRLGAR